MAFSHERNLESGNVFISHSISDDESAQEAGYEFIGVSLSESDGEVHVWRIFSLNTSEDG